MANSYNTAIIEEFRANNGTLGGDWAGRKLVLVNTLGAKSGRPHTIPLAYLQQGERIFIVGSAGGRERHPAWYYNLLAHPHVSYELGNGPVDATATLLAGDARTAAVPDIVAAMPFFGEYQAKMTRQIPVFVLTPR